jgi:fibronectin type 3 domain-containing protein
VSLEADQPARLVTAGQLRQWRYAQLDFAPFRYNPALSRLSVVRSVTIQVHFRRDPALLARAAQADGAMDDQAAAIFDNFTQARPEYELLRAQSGAPAGPSAAPSEYLILTTQTIYNHSALGQFMLYLNQHGYSASAYFADTPTVTGQPGAELADKIRHFLTLMWQGHPNLKYVLLVGSPDPGTGDVPMKMTHPLLLTHGCQGEVPTPTDLYYADLTGNWDLNGNGQYGEYPPDGQPSGGDLGPGGVDLFAELYVGRIPVYNADYASLDSILYKIINQQTIPHRQPWQNNTLMAMTFWGQHYNSAVLGYDLIKNFMTPAAGFSSYTIYMHHWAPDPCSQISGIDPNTYMDDWVVASYWSQHPVGLAVTAGHGSFERTAIGWGTETTDCWLPGDLFNSYQTAYLDDTRPAFAVLNSCENGHPEDTFNMQYALLRQGAVSAVGATRVTWLDEDGDTIDGLPTNYTSGAGISYNYVRMLSQGDSAGKAIMMSRTYAPPWDDGRLMNYFDFNLYGDPASIYRVPPALVVPSAPSNLTASNIVLDGDPAFDAQWQDNSSGEEYFRILLSAPGLSDVTHDVAFNSTTARLMGIACGKNYTIKVKAVNGSLESAWSAPYNISSPPCLPTAPTGLNASLSGNNIVLQWIDTSHNADKFNIYRSQKIGSYYLPPILAGSTANGSITTFTDTTAACSHTFSYRVTAENITGESPSSSSVVISSQVCPPAAPTMQAAVSGQTSVQLNWTDNSSYASQEAGFEVWWRPTTIGIWHLLITLPPNTTQYLVGGLSCDGGAVIYKVRAYNAGGSADSGTVSAGPSACTAPAAPDDLFAESSFLNQHEISLSWDDNSDNEWGFQIERLDAVWTQIATVAANETGYIDTGLDPGTSHTYRVRAYNSLESGYSSQVTGTTADLDDNMPTDLQATATSSSTVDLSWRRGAGLPTGYNIHRTRNPARGIPTSLGPVTATSYQDSGLLCGTRYYYSVNAFSDLGPLPMHWSSPYTPYIAVTTFICPPAAPAGITVTTVSQSELGLSWLPPAGTVDGYYVERATPGLGDWTRVYTTDASTTAIIDAGISCGTQKSYRVQAYNIGGISLYSTEVNGETAVCTPDAPDHLTADNFRQNGLTLNWNSSSYVETGYRIERSQGRLPFWTGIYTVTYPTQTYADTNLTCGVPYSYRILAFNSSGYSASSAVLHTSTISCTPVLQAAPGLEGLVTLSWSDPSQNTTAYTLQRSPDGSSGWATIASPPGSQHALNDLYEINPPTAACGSTLYYRLAATNGSGTSPYSSPPASAATLCVPTAAINLAVSWTTGTQVRLTWSIASGGGQTGFVIERSLADTIAWQDVTSLGAGVTTFTDSNLLPGTGYIYRVLAVNTGGNKASNVVNAQTKHLISLPLLKK